MTRIDLQNLTLSWLDDLNATYFTPTQVNAWLNNGQREAQKQLIQAGENFYVKRVSTICVTNADTYALPDDFMRLHKLEIVLSGVPPNEVRDSLYFVTLGQLDQVSMSTGTPEAYCIRKNCLVIRPIPDSAKTLYMDYSPIVSDMTLDSDMPNVPTQYQEYIAVLATIDGLLKDQRDPSPMLAKKEFYLQLMKADSENRQVSQPREVVSTECDSWGSLW